MAQYSFKARISKLGKKNPMYKHGLAIRNKYICPKCKIHKMSTGHSKSCRQCYYKTLKGKGNPLYGKRGILSPNYKGKQYYCIDCGKKVSRKYYKRCHSCAGKVASKKILANRRSYKGKNNPNYINGRSNKPYPLEFNETLKLSIRERDKFTCQNCEMIEEEHLIIYGTVLIIHHIDYNKENCNENNLITLCNQCNVRANYNRKYWQKIYKEKSNVRSI